MQQKQLAVPEPPLLDRSIHRFYPSFSILVSLFAATFLIEIFVAEILSPTISLSTNQTILVLIPYLLFLLLFIPSYTYIWMKAMSITSSPTAISGLNLWCLRIHTSWQDIILVKSYQIFGIRSIYLKSAKGRMKTIHCTPQMYDELPSILDRVREYAGEDHPLTIALEKELSLPRQQPLRRLWQIIGVIAIMLSVWLVGGNLYAAYREQPLNQAISTYVRQHPKTVPNQSAIDLQASISKLGFSVGRFGDGSKVQVKPDKISIAEWKKISPILDGYISKKLNKMEDSSELFPAQLHVYLSNYRIEITTIQNQLLNNDLPNWGSDASWIENSNPTAGDSILTEGQAYLDILHLQRLLIADLLDRQQLPNSEISQDLKVIKKLGRSFQNQNMLLGQIVARANIININRLARHLDFMPMGWEDDLVNVDRHKMMQTGIEHELMIQARAIQEPRTLDMIRGDKLPFSFIIKYHHLARPYARMLAVDSYEKSQHNLSYWMNQNICRTDGNTGIKYLNNALDISSYPLQYVKLKTDDLDRELTTGVRQIKSQLGAGEQIDRVVSKFKLASQACPGEQWTAKVNDGAVAISFSHPPNWKALGMDEKSNFDRFTYLIKPKATNNNLPTPSK